MSPPPNGKHHALRERQRATIKQLADFSSKMPMQIPIDEMATLLDYIDELEEADYASWERSMGEDL